MIKCYVSWCKFNNDDKCYKRNKVIQWDRGCPVCNSYQKIYSEKEKDLTEKDFHRKHGKWYGGTE